MPLTMRNRVASLLGFAVVIAARAVFAASVRDFTRPSTPSGTAVTETQASELTLTLTEAAMRPIQTWVRTAGTIDSSGSHSHGRRCVAPTRTWSRKASACGRSPSTRARR